MYPKQFICFWNRIGEIISLCVKFAWVFPRTFLVFSDLREGFKKRVHDGPCAFSLTSDLESAQAIATQLPKQFAGASIGFKSEESLKKNQKKKTNKTAVLAPTQRLGEIFLLFNELIFSLCEYKSNRLQIMLLLRNE